MSEQKNLKPILRFKQFSDNWIFKNLNQVGEVVNGLTYNPSNISKDGILVLRSSNIKGNQLSFLDNVFVTVDNFNAVKKNDILICVRNGSRNLIGKNALITEEAEGLAFGAFMSIFRSNNNRFIFQLFATKNYFKTIHENLGATINSINNSEIKQFKFAFPSENEQQKIATFLTAVDEKINLLQKRKKGLEQYKKGVMQQLFSQKLRFKKEDGSDYPDWEEKKLGEISNFRRGSFPQPYGLKKWYDDKNGFPFIQVYDVADNLRLKETTKRKISQAAKELSVFVKKGTLILTIQGSIGRMAITEYDACIDRTLLIFQSYKLPIDISFFMYVVYLLFTYEKELAVGGTIKTITKEKLSEFNVSLPCLEEQKQIAVFLINIDKKLDIVDSQLNNMKQFKKGLLQQMFV